jgi:isoleucyl-tRNA synthetase
LFRPVPTEADFATLETEELARWSDHRVFERSIELRAGAEPWVFYEGPPTANGRPGLHHVWARAYKDLFCRYRTMRGYAVPRKAGWDTHGLPVEVEVEKQLGITDKRQIEEEVGIAEFVRLCRESVRNYVGDWKLLTERIGYWIDIDDAYWTFSPDYIESVWWELKQIWDQGLLYEDIKVVPYCTRCGTALSSHELGQPDVYRPVVDESAFVRFPLLDEGDAAARLAASLGRDTVEGL